MSFDLISRSEARESSKTRYFTGKPCKRGHIAERKTCSASCIECSGISDARWKKTNVKKCSAQKRVWCGNNREKVRAIKKKWNAEHDKDGQKVRSRRWYLANQEKANKQQSEWAKRNPELRTATAAKYRASKLKQMPKWANVEKIKEIYKQARTMTESTGIVHHVDHIIPLQSDIVSGLHVEANLQILYGKANQSKGNRLLAA